MSKTKKGGKIGASKRDSDKKLKQMANRKLRRVNKRKTHPDDIPMIKDQAVNTWDLKPAW